MDEHECQATDYLRRHGHVRCDIRACNCGSWHHRFGLPERWDEIKDALAEAGHPLCNENGNIVLRALAELVAERDMYKASLAGVDASLGTNLVAQAQTRAAASATRIGSE